MNDMKNEYRRKNAFENEEVFNTIRRGTRTKFLGEKLTVTFLIIILIGIIWYMINQFNVLSIVFFSSPKFFGLLGVAILLICIITAKYHHCFVKYDSALNTLLKEYSPLDSLAYSTLICKTRDDPEHFLDHLKDWCAVEEKKYNKVRIKEIENDERMKAKRYDFTDE